MLRRLALILCAVTPLAPISAETVSAGTVPAPLPGGLRQGVAGRVARVVDGDTLILDDGDAVRLIGIQAPRRPLGYPGTRPWRLASRAKAALEALVLGRRVRLFYGGRRVDRYGRRLAQLVRDDGLWVQGAMLARGLARVYSFADNRAGVPDMLAIERTARARNLGLWADPYYRIRTVAEAARSVGGFQIVEGTVRVATEVRGRLYLNFGDDWRTDFTILIDKRARRAFTWPWRSPGELDGRRIRVRGWVKRWNGPMIEVDHPEQIEMLDPEIGQAVRASGAGQ